MSFTPSLALPLIAVPPQETEAEQRKQNCSLLCGHFLTLLLPLVLFLQFGAEFQVQNDATAEIGWSVMNLSISLFAVTTFLHKESLSDLEVPVFAKMMPEIIVLAVSSLIFYDEVLMAFLVMVAGAFLVALSVVAVSAYQLMSVTITKENVDPQTKSKEVSILIV